MTIRVQGSHATVHRLADMPRVPTAYCQAEVLERADQCQCDGVSLCDARWPHHCTNCVTARGQVQQRRHAVSRVTCRADH